jgi:hypothetical protein
MNYLEMTDLHINCKVAIALFDGCSLSPSKGGDGDCFIRNKNGVLLYDHYNPCQNEEDAWPIIDLIWDELTKVVPVENEVLWRLVMFENGCDKLRAAMIAFLQMNEDK